MLAIHNLPFVLETVTRLPAPPRLPADLARLAAECDAGFSPLAGTCVETAARAERARDNARRVCFLAQLIRDTLKGL